MKIKLLTAAMLFSALFSTAHAADVGVSVSIGQPGFYGRIDIGDYPYPPPRVIYRQPRIVERVYIEREPIICAFRRATPKIGPSFAADIMRAVNLSILFRITGITMIMHRVTVNIIMMTGMKPMTTQNMTSMNINVKTKVNQKGKVTSIKAMRGIVIFKAML